MLSLSNKEGKKTKEPTTQILQSSKIQRKKATFGFGNIKKGEIHRAKVVLAPLKRCVGKTLGWVGFLKFRISGILNVVKFNVTGPVKHQKAS